MTNGEQEIRDYLVNRDRLEAAHAYDPSTEHDACGVGVIAALDGKPRREVVLMALEALKALWHRGAVDADGKTGDGAGIHVEVSQDFFRREVERSGHDPAGRRIGVGMIFLARAPDFAAQERCRTIVETQVLASGFYIFGWRQVPIDTRVIGEKANATRPDIEQIMFAIPEGLANDDLERRLYLCRRRIEKQVRADSINDFYICSLSARSLIYKGMFLAEQLDNFYPDLKDEHFVSSMAIYHQRYSTNTFPQWWLAQPFRMLAHNGEINTVKGNVNWMKSHEIRMASDVFGNESDERDIKPVIPPGSSDSAALDAVFELFVARRPQCAARQDHHDAGSVVEDRRLDAGLAPGDVFLRQHHHGAVGWPGRDLRLRWALGCRRHGPQRSASAALLADRRRPPHCRLGNRHGAAPRGAREGTRTRRPRADDRSRPARGPLLSRPGNQGRTRERQALPEVGCERHRGRAIDHRRTASRGTSRARNCGGANSSPDSPSRNSNSSFIRWRKTAKKPSARWATTPPFAVLSERYRPLSHFFRQNFSQVTNPPIDPLREYRVHEPDDALPQPSATCWPKTRIKRRSSRSKARSSPTACTSAYAARWSAQPRSIARSTFRPKKAKQVKR